MIFDNNLFSSNILQITRFQLLLLFFVLWWRTIKDFCQFIQSLTLCKCLYYYNLNICLINTYIIMMCIIISADLCWSCSERKMIEKCSWLSFIFFKHCFLYWNLVNQYIYIHVCIHATYMKPCGDWKAWKRTRRYCARGAKIVIKNNSHSSWIIPKTHPPIPRSIFYELRE